MSEIGQKPRELSQHGVIITGIVTCYIANLMMVNH